MNNEIASWLIWDAMRRRRYFTSKEVSQDANCSENTVFKYTQKLVEIGALEIHVPRKLKFDSNTYRLVDKFEGYLKMPIDSPATDRDRIWNSMRILNRFTNPDLQVSSGATKDSVDWFLKRLKNVGIVGIITPHNSGVNGSFATYKLVRDLGVFTPVCLKDRVFDTNALKFLEKDNGESC